MLLTSVAELNIPLRTEYLEQYADDFDDNVFQVDACVNGKSKELDCGCRGKEVCIHVEWKIPKQ